MSSAFEVMYIRMVGTVGTCGRPRPSDGVDFIVVYGNPEQTVNQPFINALSLLIRPWGSECQTMQGVHRFYGGYHDR